jgi:dihydrodipicolinate synthase/N-acetylneuraminate lyase
LEHPIIKIAGVSGDTDQALKEAEICSTLGYDLVLLSSNGMGHWSEQDLLARAEKVAEVMPVFGFYLQPAVGGRSLSFEFWKAFSEIENVHAIKIAPFNRYQTLDVVRAVCHSSRCDEIALYTGNDDNIIADLLTTYKLKVNGQEVEKAIVGGLLGHWAVWTKMAVQIFNRAKNQRAFSKQIPKEMLALNIAITDANAAFFDAANNFKGCIAGLHEVLRRQGLLEGIWCLDPNEKLSPGQMEEINRVYKDYPFLNDDKFVKDNFTKWLKAL